MLLTRQSGSSNLSADSASENRMSWHFGMARDFVINLGTDIERGTMKAV